jgi:hypothetical protein
MSRKEVVRKGKMCQKVSGSAAVIHTLNMQNKQTAGRQQENTVFPEEEL